MLSYTRFLLILEDKKTFLKTKYSIDDNTMDKIASIDPDPKHKHLEWLVSQHKKGNLDINNNHHVEQHKNVLANFQRFQPKTENGKDKGIHTFKDIHELNNTINDHLENNSKIKERWGERVFNQDGHEIWKSSTPKHCENHGESTSWCTAIKGGLHQRKYFGKDKPALYTHYPPNTPKPGESGHTKGNRFQFYAGEDDYIGHDYGKKPELGNSANHPINPETHEHSFPVLKQSKHWNEFKSAWHNHNIHQETSIDDEHDHDEGYENPHDLAHSQNHNDRVRAVELGFHREPDGAHLITDDHHSVKEAVLDYEKARRNENEHRYQHILNQVHAASPIDNPDNEEIHYHISRYTKNPDILHKYAGPSINDEYEHMLHSNVAQNHHTKAEDLLHLAKTSNKWVVHRDLAANAKTPEEGIQAILKHPEGPSDIYHHILSRQDGDKYIDQIAKHQNPMARRVATKYTDDPEHLEQLHKDVHPKVHEELAKRFPEKEYKFPDKEVRYQAAYSIISHYIHYNKEKTLSDAHKKILTHLANPDDKFNSPNVRKEVAKHPDMHDHMLNDSIVKDQIAKTTNNHEHLKRLVKDNDTYVSTLASNNALNRYKNKDNPKMQEIYDHMAQSGHNNQMELAAMHSKNPDTLHHLATVSNNYHVHSNVVRNPHTLDKTLDHIQNRYKNSTNVLDLHRDIEDAKARRNK